MVGFLREFEPASASTKANRAQKHDDAETMLYHLRRDVRDEDDACNDTSDAWPNVRDDGREKMTIRPCTYKGVQVISHMESCWKRWKEADAIGAEDVSVQMIVCCFRWCQEDEM